MAEIPVFNQPNSLAPKEDRIAYALETIAQAQVAQAEDIREIVRAVNLIASKAAKLD